MLDSSLVFTHKLPLIILYTYVCVDMYITITSYRTLHSYICSSLRSIKQINRSNNYSYAKSNAVKLSILEMIRILSIIKQYYFLII